MPSCSIFYRLDADQRAMPLPLEGLYASAAGSACWVIGGGPSLAALPCDAIARSPIPRMCLNLAGTRLLRPNFWTSYDPTARFHRSIYLDPSIIKFVHRRRAMDLVPESTWKVSDCPAVVCFDRETGRGFSNLISDAAAGIVDWSDSLIQSVDILYRLGFRKLYLAGCELRIRPSTAQQDLASAQGLDRRPRESLQEFVTRCEQAGLSRGALEHVDPPRQYHFDEAKPLAAAIQTDLHYYRTAQGLRLARRCFAEKGLQLVSVTPESRLNDYFPYVPVETAIAEIAATVGDPLAEPTRGLYTQRHPRWSADLEPMRDIKPPNWPASQPASPEKRSAVAIPAIPVRPSDEVVIEREGYLTTPPVFADAFVPPREEG